MPEGSARLFGTDGVRGVANEDLSLELVTGIGRAAATVLGRGHERPRFTVGTDTRASADSLTAALTAGLCSAGADVELLGVIPSAGVAWCTVESGAQAGVVISASHNPAPDNGVKFFGPDGYKLPDALEDDIQSCLEGAAWAVALGSRMGRSAPRPDMQAQYAAHVAASCPRSLDGLHVVLDCANGAASVLGPHVLALSGARLDVICASPDGVNINEGCGATDLALLAGEVVRVGADLGLALDGDADRMLAVDARGQVVDGDQLLAIVATDRKARDALRGGAVVATVMSNLGLHRALERAGIGVVTSAVGDRYVLEALRRESLELGGEQSGHLLFLDLATAGDGMLTALQLCAVLAGSGRSLADLASMVERYPQVLLNVHVPDKRAAMADPSVAAAISAAEARLGHEGRVLVRPSGTESIVRVMVEASEETLARDVADEIAAVIASFP